jgi:adenylate cyclase
LPVGIPDRLSKLRELNSPGSARQFTTETVFVDRDQLCEKSENLFGRADCGPVYKQRSIAGEPGYAYVNSSKVFYFSPVQ